MEALDIGIVYLSNEVIVKRDNWLAFIKDQGKLKISNKERN